MTGSTSTSSGATADQLATLYDAANAQSHRDAGYGNGLAMYQTMLSQFDRIGVNPLPVNHEVAGYTFITRPKLNLQTTSLRQDRILAMLDTADPYSLPFAVRCYLDTYYSRMNTITKLAKDCPFFNEQVPFLIPLTNNLVSVSGWPDPVLEPITTDGGFFSEDMTIAKGSDRLNRTYDLTLTFRDVQGGFIISLLWMWIHYIELVLRGDVTAYPEDISARRINYTCSIYRFVLDPSRQFITKWSKATGCWPRTVPIGNFFNFGEKENFLSSAMQYSVPFSANKVEIMDPIIFRDFNKIVKRYAGNWVTDGPVQKVNILDASQNFMGVPYIDVVSGYNQINFLYNSATPVVDPYAATIQQYRDMFMTA